MKTKLLLLGLTTLCCISTGAQGLKIKGVLENNRYDDGDQWKSEYLGWNSELGKAIFIVDQGIYAMTWNGTTLSTPTKEPAVNKSEIKGNNEKEIWANNFNLMYGNSGACYVDGIITTVTSRDYQSTEDEELFAVRQWDAKTGDLKTPSDVYMNVSRNLESAGMSYNPKDGKVYGLFYISAADLPSSVTEDPEYFTDEDDADWDREGKDAGYAICTINLETMEVTPITPGLYYQNFVTFAINSDGRAFAMTSGGTNGYLDEDGRVRDMNDNLSGAQLCEFDLTTGLMKTKKVMVTENVYDDEGNITGTEEVEEDVNIYDHGTGYCSQYRRQSACFAKSNPNVMFWNGYYNSGKGVNDWGSWSSLSDKEWRTNGKYDTCLYAVDINTGTAERLSKIDNRCSFASLWVDGDDCSDGAGQIILNAIENVNVKNNGVVEVYNLSGQKVNASQKGIQLVRNGSKVIKVMK